MILWHPCSRHLPYLKTWTHTHTHTHTHKHTHTNTNTPEIFGIVRSVEKQVKILDSFRQKVWVHVVTEHLCWFFFYVLVFFVYIYTHITHIYNAHWHTLSLSHTHTHTHAHTRTHLHTHTHTSTHTYTRIHARTHAHTHTHKHLRRDIFNGRIPAFDTCMWVEGVQDRGPSPPVVVVARGAMEEEGTFGKLRS